MAVLDSAFLMDLQHGHKGALHRLDELEQEGAPIRVPAAAWVEYLHTLDPAERAEATRSLEAATSFEAFTREFAEEAARLQHDLARAGKRLGWHDLQMAATSLYLREPLVSNGASFRRVPALQVQRY